MNSFAIPLRHPMVRILLALLATAWLGLMTAHAAERTVDPKAEPNVFMEAVANNMLDAVKADPEALKGDTGHITEIVRKFALPYVNMEKTTRLAAGRHWRDASDEQRKQLVQAFTGTLIRTYSGAFTQVTQGTTIQIQPFRGDPQADDAVVRTSVSRRNGSPVGVDYRLERTDDGWRVYDLNVEGIWLIQNYRNQFSQEIGRNGVDGLIRALESKQ